MPIHRDTPFFTVSLAERCSEILVRHIDDLCVTMKTGNNAHPFIILTAKKNALPSRVRVAKMRLQGKIQNLWRCAFFNSAATVIGRLSSYSKATSKATIAYDNANRIINLADTRGSALTQSFAYYFNDSLTNYTDNAMTRSYEYDADGNRGTEIGNISSTAIAYLYATDSNHLMQLKGARTERFEYDAVGNIVSDATNKYTYNTSNQLVNVSNPAGSTSYLFDPLGQRVAKLASGDNVTYFTYDTAGRLIGEYTHSQSTEYVWMGNSPVAVLKKNGGDPATLYTIHTDHLGTPRQVTHAETNQMVWEWFGEPFGTITPDEDPGHTGKKFTLNLRYAGQYYDQESNLFHNGFRDYNPQIGRYVQSDPIGLAGGINTYIYVRGNPISYVDPLGLANGPAIKWMMPKIPNNSSVRPDGLPLGAGCGDESSDCFVPDNLAGADLIPACRSHDDCYDTQGSDQNYCDSKLGRDIKRTCDVASAGGACYVASWFYPAAIKANANVQRMLGNSTPFETAQKNAK